MGLELKPNKTRICHTLNSVDGQFGFDFLGFTSVPTRREQNISQEIHEGFQTIINQVPQQLSDNPGS